MQKKTNWLAVFSVVMTGLFLVSAGIALFNEKEVVPEGYMSPSEVQNEVTNAIEDINGQLAVKDAKITELTDSLAEKAVEVAEEVKESLGYLIDGIFLGDVVAKEMSDREVKTLLDSEVSFDGEDYDFEEVITLDKMNVSANEEDFEGTPYLVIPTNSIEYKVVFDSDMSNLNISDEETLEFTFLGEEVEVSEWKSNEVTFSKGTETMLDSGETLDVNGKTLTLTHVMEDSVYVTVDGESKKIDEGETKTINGVEIEVKNVIYSEVGPVTKAVLVTGEEVKTEVKDRDEYEDDSIWEYEVTNNSIGLRLSEEFTELDEEYMPLSSGDKLCLPNDYVCIRYDGVLAEDMEELRFDLDTREGTDYVEVRGNFQSGLDDFDRLYIKRSDGTIYDEDLVKINGTITVGDSEVLITLENYINNTGKYIEVGDFLVDINLDSSQVYDWNEEATWTEIDDDVDYRTVFGIWVSNPEDSIDDQEWTISVPHEKLESTITVM